MRPVKNLLLAPTNANLIMFTAYFPLINSRGNFEMCDLGNLIDPDLRTHMESLGISIVALEKAKESTYEGIYVFPNFFLFASDFSETGGAPLSEFSFSKLVWGTDYIGGRIYLTDHLNDQPDEIVSAGVIAVDNSMRTLRETHRGRLEITSLTMRQIEEAWTSIAPHDQVELNYDADGRTGIVFLRNWEDLVDFRYRPIRPAQLLEEVAVLILSQVGLTRVVLKDANFFEEKSPLYRDLERLLSDKGLTVVDWGEFASGKGLRSYPEALIFNKKFLGLGMVFCFDSTLNILFRLQEYSNAKVLELSSEALGRVLVRSDAVSLVRENIEWMKEASALLNTHGLDDPSLELNYNGLMSTLAMERALVFDLRRQRDSARRAVSHREEQERSVNHGIMARIIERVRKQASSGRR